MNKRLLIIPLITLSIVAFLFITLMYAQGYIFVPRVVTNSYRPNDDFKGTSAYLRACFSGYSVVYVSGISSGLGGAETYYNYMGKEIDSSGSADSTYIYTPKISLAHYHCRTIHEHKTAE